jgi:hypothetical protein
MRKFLWRTIVGAAPTCTLYRRCFNRDAMQFKVWPYYWVTALEIAQNQ